MSLASRRMIPRVFRLHQGTSQLHLLPSLSHRQYSSALFRPSEVVRGHTYTGSISKTLLRDLSSSLPRSAKTPELIETTLPVCCPGCGAYAQTVEPNEPGYYNKTRKQTRKLLAVAPDDGSSELEREHAITAIQHVVDESETAPKPNRGALLENVTDTLSQYLEKSKRPVQVCDRCHDLLHHNKAVPAISPSIYSIRAFLDESPFKHNHIYHLIDAADFPLSLVDNIYEELSIQDQRSRNRRSVTEKYRHGRKLPTISFVITRADLLAPTKELLDSKMEYVRTILREKFNIPADEFRMGNVHMISAHRGWWTKKVKEEIREHGGGIWIVGKANVGKSSFVEACLPKDSRNLEKMAELIERRQAESKTPPTLSDSPALISNSLLPPAPREDLYPVLPVISSLPGTTVSPIRIPFGRGRGEVVDLPGLDRGELTNHVLEEHKRDLIMTKRVKPDRQTIKPGQSLLLGGGLVRITPVNPDDVVLAACFLPMEAHLTKTEKAIEMQSQQRQYPGTNIVKEGTGEVISSAGIFDLKWDVTQSHLPTFMAKAMNDRGVQPPRLPYRVMSADILVEGCGWVELTAQVRATSVRSDGEEAVSFPQVEIFTPNGQHIGSRQPIECWKFTAKKQAADRRKRSSRGRQNVGQKKRILHST